MHRHLVSHSKQALLMLLATTMIMLSILAFTVFVGTAVVTELISFAFPAALLMWRARAPKYLPKKSIFNLGKMGWLVNFLVVVWMVVATVVFSMPVTQPVTTGTMSKSAKFGRGCGKLNSSSQTIRPSYSASWQSFQ